MMDRELRRIRDRKFIPFDWERHWLRTFVLARCAWSCFDLFPPVAGYCAYKGRKKAYHVSPKSQHRDWANAVVARDRECQICGRGEDLQAHHVWTQGSFYHLRYVLRNGMTLCRWCHAESPPVYNEISPNQLRWLTAETKLVNANVEEPESNEYPWYAGRLKLFDLGADELDWESPDVISALEEFKATAWANLRVESARALAKGPYPDRRLSLNEAFIAEIEAHDPRRCRQPKWLSG